MHVPLPVLFGFRACVFARVCVPACVRVCVCLRIFVGVYCFPNGAQHCNIFVDCGLTRPKQKYTLLCVRVCARVCLRARGFVCVFVCGWHTAVDVEEKGTLQLESHCVPRGASQSSTEASPLA